MNKLVTIICALCFTFVHSAWAGQNEIEKTLQKMGVQAESITASPVAGISMIMTKDGIFYLSNDGRYLFRAPLFDASGEKAINLTNKALMNQLNALESEMIIYKAPQEKYVVTIFSDITCSYCQKLHSKVKEYNDLGITIRYLAFPRQGLAHASAKQMQSIWCSGFKNKSLDAAFRGDPISAIDSCKIDISKHYELGALLDVKGTPAIVLEDGTLLSGYLEPANLAEVLAKK